ncbi:hypothetical protein IH980_00425 [Patescibacteria group bacterium]|nr:hypothetical protein [Patescibacteria group bacterium]
MTEKNVDNINHGESEHLAHEQKSFSSQELAGMSISLLEKKRERFINASWTGGIGEEKGPYDLDSILAVLSRLADGGSFRRVSANSHLAIAEGLAFTGVGVSGEELARLRQEAELERARFTESILVPATHALSREIDTQNGKSLPKGRILVLAGVLVLIGGGAAWFASSPSQALTEEGLQPRVLNESGNLLQIFQGGSDQGSDQSGLTSLFRPIQEAVGEFINPIPLVEDVESDSENPNIVLGIDWTNTEAGVSVAWDDPEIAASRLGIPPEIILFPVAKKENINMMDQCLPFLGLDCSWVHDGSITVGAHVGSDDEGTHFSFQDLKDSLERKAVVEEVVDEQGNTQEKITWVPLSIDEQREIIAKLESVRPTVRQVIVTERDGKKEVEVVEVKAKVAIVRIPPLEADRHYAAWFDYNRDDVIKIALEVDPTLGERVNLNKDFVVIIGCDERLPEEPFSQRIDPSSTYQAMWLTFLGEAPAGQL